MIYHPLEYPSLRGLDVVRIYLLQAISIWEITLTTALERSDPDIIKSIRESQSCPNIDLSLLGKLFISGRSESWLAETKVKVTLCLTPQLSGGLKKMVRLRNKLAHGKSLLESKQDYTEVKNCFHDTFILMSTFDTCVIEGFDLEDFNSRPFLLGNGKVLHSEQVFHVMIKSVPSCLTQSSRLLFSQAQEFVGQERLLQRIEEMLRPPVGDINHVNRCQRIVLHGPPGIGKTAIVRKLSSRLANVFRKQYCFQASNGASLLADIPIFLAAEGYRERGREQFRDALQQCEYCLFLVFEDVQNPEMIMPFLPSDKHCVIFTSYSDLIWRALDLIPEHITSVQVKALTTNESLSLIRRILKKARKLELFNSLTNGSHRKDTTTFLEEGLQNLPLAVRLLAFQLIEGTFTVKSVISSISYMENNEHASERSMCDQQAAGRVHIRGFFHLMKSALRNLSPVIESSPAVFALAILPSGLSFLFFRELSTQLGFVEKDTNEILEQLLQAGLVMLDFENRKIIMHQVIQRYVKEHLSWTTSGFATRIADATISVAYAACRRSSFLRNDIISLYSKSYPREELLFAGKLFPQPTTPQCQSHNTDHEWDTCVIEAELALLSIVTIASKSEMKLGSVFRCCEAVNFSHHCRTAYEGATGRQMLQNCLVKYSTEVQIRKKNSLLSVAEQGNPLEAYWFLLQPADLYQDAVQRLTATQAWAFGHKSFVELRCISANAPVCLLAYGQLVCRGGLQSSCAAA